MNFWRRGPLIGYGPRAELVIRQLVRMGVRLLNGEKAAEMPIEQPRDIHLALNQKVAAQIGVKFPASLLARADEVVE